MSIELILKRTEKTDTCWLWLGCKIGGHGQIQINGKRYFVHRVIYEHFKGKIPDGLQIDHLCRVRNCVNPDHLEAVSCRENLLRGDTHAAKNAAKTHCKYDHEFTPENLRKNKLGKRICRTCDIERRRKQRLLQI